MPQSTNLNKNPYYDDFSDSKNFYKVLFKPGVTVQTRELTTLQSILQNQVEKLGSAFFKKNTVVVPGGFAYDSTFYSVEIEGSYKGIDVENYFSKLVGTTLTGRTSNVTAKVEKVLSRQDSIRNNTTLYIKYQSSSSENFTSNIFSDGEELTINQNITFDSGSILSGSSVAKTIAPTNRKSTSIASAAKIDSGVYFVRGYFVNVSTDTLVLDQYSNTPSYRVGLNISEEIINANQDSSLYDNAQGFSNFAAPGADRLKISLSLSKKSLTDFNDENFIELFRVVNGNLRKIKNETDSSYITDILARRTFDESGNYYVNPFNVESIDSLNDNLGNGGLYSEGESTENGIIPAEETGIIKVSAGKAYVQGYEIPTTTEVLSFPKPRTTAHVESSSAVFSTGNLLRVNNVKNIPNIGLTTDFTISLYDQRLSANVASGTTIGVARVYDFSSYITSYENQASQFNLHAFDIQVYSKIDTDSPLTSIVVGDYIKGNNSGSTGFVKTNSGQTLTLYQVSGQFIQNESLIVNGIGSTVAVGTFTNYSVDDIKAVSNGTFVADSLLSKEVVLTGPFSLSVDAGVGTIRSNNGSSFASNLKVADIVKYPQVGVGSDIFAKITSINATKNQIVLATTSTVPNVCSGNLGISTSLQTVSVIKSQLIQTDDPSLTTNLNNNNIANVDFLNSNIYTKVSYNSVTKSSTTLTLPSLSGTDYVYSTFNPERYIVVNADGSIENLTPATFTITGGGKNATFTNLSATAGPCKVITTQIKSNVSQKSKKLTRCASLTINKTKYTTPPNAGLAQTSVYGTRVEDDQISLNTSDIIQVHGVFESSSTSNPTLSWLELSGLNSTNSSVDDLIVGELVIGATSGAVALYAQKKSAARIDIIYKNDSVFALGETVTFSESGYTATTASINAGDKNIVNEFILDNGQRTHFYDFGRLIRKESSKEPSGRLTIFFDQFTYNTNDYGDLVAVNSYPTTLTKKLIPEFDGLRNTDVLDVRPRVTNYSSSTISPFDFASRTFTTSSNNPTQILSPNESFVFDYDFYLPRIDKLTLSKNGDFNLVLGDPSEVPIQPPISSDVLDLATIVSDAYVYNISEDVDIILSDHRRFTMSDIRDIENRVSNLEFYTTLSLLESSTQNLLVVDGNGLNRFKSGFFVDEFNNYDTSDADDLNFDALIENKTLSATTNEERIDLSLFSTDDYTAISNINLNNTNCSNLRLTGTKLSLNYSEVESSKQPFASKVVNVNPFNIVTWSGILELSPNTDTWSIVVNRTRRVRGRFGGISIRIINTFPFIRIERNRGGVETTVTSIPFIRTRNINFTAAKLKPNTRFKLLFDKRDLTTNTSKSAVFPKFIEITNISGTFQIGETVKCINSKGTTDCSFRICTPNHKSGPIDLPSTTFTSNPYNPSVGISTQYGVQSTFLNVDTSTLSRQEVSEFWGKINKGNKLVGSTSKANATVSDVRLITDNEGVLLGSIWIDESDEFKTGQSLVEVVPNTTTQNLPGESVVNSASTLFTSQGQKIDNLTVTYYDPLAQTFLVEEENGIIPTSVDVYFASKDDNLPITLEIREVSFGTPGGTDKVVPGLRKVLSASQVNISTNASVATTFTFDTLTNLSAGEYSIVLLSDSLEYNVWVSELGAEDISTVNLPTVNKIFISKQPSLGTLFKSQNGTTWVPSPLEDLKFTLKKAEFITSGGTARLYNSTVSLTSPENKLADNPIVAISTAGQVVGDGRHILVFHPNHGMHSSSNKVQITGVQSDVLPEKLTVSYATTDSGAISVASTAIFTTFEGTTVSVANPGYVQISNEIIKYENVGTNQLLNVTRGFYGTTLQNHNINDLVYKYEFNNVSLNRINTEHTVVSNPNPTLNNYYIQVSAGSSFTQTKLGGGENVYATKNKQFSELTFNDRFIERFNNTQVSASVRTITSTSVDGSEVSFIDSGSQTVGISSINNLETPRMVASRVNETTYLNATNFAGSRSFTLELNLSTNDQNVSPLIDLTQNFAIGKIYNINQPVGLSSYASDNRANSNTDDSHDFAYVSNRVNLEQSADSLKVLFSAYRHSSSDVRVLYKIFTNDTPDNEQIWNLFPGYDNLDVNGNVINSDNNDGRSDLNVRSSLNGEYLDYTFTIDNLPSFTGFQIKILGTGTNQAYSPLIRELRAIALRW